MLKFFLLRYGFSTYYPIVVFKEAGFIFRSYDGKESLSTSLLGIKRRFYPGR